MATVYQFPEPTRPEPPEPRLREAIRSSGLGVITTWLEKHRGARAKMRIRVQNMRKILRIEWSENYFKAIRNGDGLYEVRWQFQNKQFRAGGFDSGGYFILVVGFTHKDHVYDPPDWLETGKRRMREVKRGERQHIPFEP